MRTRASRPSRSTAPPQPSAQSKRWRTQPASEVFPMLHRGLSPAAQSHLSPSAFSAQSMSCEERNGNGERPSFKGTLASEVRGDLFELPQPRNERVTSAQWEPSVPYPAFCTVTASGPYRRPAARRRSASTMSPLRVSVPPKRSLKAAAKNAAQTSFGPHQESTPWRLGAGPTRLASPV